jgi:eukaryotic-like serine/threonine-protein kinase
MSTTQWPRLRSLFEQALALPVAQRDAFLAAESAGDAELVNDVKTLLAAHDKFAGHTASQQRIVEQQSDTLLAKSLPQIGQTLGAYTLERELGRGGMGVVYLAQRHDGVVQQTVAIKLLANHATDAASRERFAREREILASLQHPDIARLLDAGESDNGQQYFVMEYVQGQPITEYCVAQQLSVTQRVALMERVARAVSYAHRQLVIHRDIKPSNILVDANGAPKLIDFGIAKAISLDSAQTGTAQRFFSPHHAAPEQLRGGAVGVTCDVYQLGTVLYELLCGRPVFDFEGQSAAQVEEAILGKVPSAPSTSLRRPSPAHGRGAGGEGQLAKVSNEEAGREGKIAKISNEEAESEGQANNAQIRHPGAGRGPFFSIATKVRKWIPAFAGMTNRTLPSGFASHITQGELQGDLDTITLKALRKEPNQRYADADAFADDLQRYLTNRPIIARSNQKIYRLKKFCQRHWLPLTASAIVLALGTSLVVNTVLKNRQIAFQRDTAIQERDKANAVSDFLVGIFDAANYPGEMTVKTPIGEVLDQGVKRLNWDLKNEPSLRAKLMSLLSSVYTNAGDQSKAHHLAAEALNILERDAPQDWRGKIEALYQLSDLTRADANNKESVRFADQALQLHEQLGDDLKLRWRTEVLKWSVFSASGTKQAHKTAAEKIRILYDQMRLAFGENSIDVAEVGLYLADRLCRTRDAPAFLEAEKYACASLKTYQNANPLKPLSVAGAQESVASALMYQNRTSEALPLMQKAYETQIAARGEDNVDAVRSLIRLGNTARRAKTFEQAITYYKKAVSLAAKFNNERPHPAAAAAYFSMADTYYGSMHDVKNGLENFRLAFTTQAAAMGDAHPNTIHFGYTLATVLGDEFGLSKERDDLLVRMTSAKAPDDMLANLLLLRAEDLYDHGNIKESTVMAARLDRTDRAQWSETEQSIPAFAALQAKLAVANKSNRTPTQTAPEKPAKKK